MRKPRAIIYDDESMILDVLEQFFTKRGYEVFLYGSPVVCPYENLFDSCSDLPPCADIIISDYNMPDMTGIELFQRQSSRGCRADIKMKAIMTGACSEEILKQCEDLGCRYFQKPFSFSELSDWLNEREKFFDLSSPLKDRRENMRYDLKHSNPLKDRREKMRYDFDHEIEYRINSQDSQKVFVGKTVDKNDKGLGLRIFTRLHSGEKITIVKGFEAAPLNGVVTWCSKHGENTYKAGLQILKS